MKPIKTLLGVAKVVNDQHIMAALNELDHGVGANVASAAGDEDCHDDIQINSSKNGKEEWEVFCVYVPTPSGIIDRSIAGTGVISAEPPTPRQR